MPDLMDVLRQAGFSGQGLSMAYAIAMAESGGNARAFNGNTGTGDQSYGLFQINMLGGMGPERRKQYGLSSNDDLYDAARNAEVAYKMSKGGTDWSPWSTYKRGEHKKFLGQAGQTVTGADQAQAALDGETGELPPGPADITSSAIGKDFAPGTSDFAPGNTDFAQRVKPSQPAAGGSPAGGAATAYKGGASDMRDKAIAAAMAVLGTPYSWGGGGTSGASYGIASGGRDGRNIRGFDCSSLLMYAYAQAGYSIPRVSWDQIATGERTSIENLRPGDFVAWGSGGHIAMYIGDGQVIESPRTGLTVRVRKLGSNEDVFGVRLNLPGD